MINRTKNMNQFWMLYVKESFIFLKSLLEYFQTLLVDDTEINGPLCLSSICVNFHTKRYFPTHYISYIDYIILKAVRSNKCINMYLVMP